MTREEAIEIVERSLLKINGIPNAGRDYAHIRRQAEIGVECNVALGMLKLDEPKSAEPITLCGEDPDWNWWLSQHPEFKAQAVKEFRAKMEEPKRLTEKIHAAMCDTGYAFLRSDDFKECMESHGLQITEK